MNLQRPLMLAGVVLAAAAAVGVWAFRILPPGATIPVHFSPHGDPDGFMPKGVGLALMPAIGVLVTAILAYAPRLTPDRSGLEQSTGVYGVLLIGVAAMFLVAEAAVAMRAMDPDFDVIRWLFLAIGILFVLVGNVLGKLRHNFLLGIRTPWTLKDKRVWDRTHRFTGRLMVMAGLVLAAVAAAGVAHDLLIWVLIACAAAPGVAGFAYSRAIGSQSATRG
jgi:uncharacterized membrane protein